MKINSALRFIVFFDVLFTALVSWFHLKTDVVKTGFFIGKNIGERNTAGLDESIRAMVEEAGFNYSSDQAEPLSGDEINKFFR